MSRATIKRKREEKDHALTRSSLERICEECSYFSEDKLECEKWLKTKKEDDRACCYFSPIQKVIMPIMEVNAAGATKKLDIFCRDLRALAEKSGYKLVVQPKKNHRIIRIHNPGNSFGRKLVKLFAKHSGTLKFRIEQKTEVKIERRKL